MPAHQPPSMHAARALPRTGHPRSALAAGLGLGLGLALATAALAAWTPARAASEPATSGTSASAASTGGTSMGGTSPAPARGPDHVRFRRGLYAGVGLGRSWTEPDAGAVEGFDVDDRVHVGAQATVGADLLHWLAVEGHVAELGTAEISPFGSIDYRQLGASAVGYVGRRGARVHRRGLLGFGRLGFGALRTDASDDIDNEQENGAHVLVGAGLEYATRTGLALRAETVVFDADVNYTQLGLLYRFGDRGIDRPAEPLVRDERGPAPAAVPAAIPTAAPVAPPPPPPAAALPADGGDPFEGTLDDITFATGGVVPTLAARNRLRGVAATLLERPGIPFEVSAHTDDVGEASDNLRLSRRRAAAVADYLVAHGVERSRFTVSAHGESRPVASNRTAAGRRANRRVEIEARR